MTAKRILLMTLLCVALCGSCLSAQSTAAKQPSRPNVVWLVSEDNSVHFLKLFDTHGAATPRIAELAEQGVIFEHAFSNSPVCSVARTTLATGCYAPRIGTQYHRRSVPVPLPDGVRMFPEYLRNAGYYTANNRKTDYNAIPGDAVWDDSSGTATWRNRELQQPFFYMESFPVCHESSLHFSEKTMHTETPQTNPASVFLAPYHPDTPTFRYTYARYHDRMGQMDQQIGKVVDRLRDDGLLEDTFLFYFGDHGGVLPRGKSYAYESGLHVPLVVRIPERWKSFVDVPPGSRQTGFVSFIDFGPTVLNLAGVQVPAGTDGRPFLGPGVTAQEVNQRDEAFGYADRFDEKYDQVRTLRKGRYKYIRNYQPFNFDGLQNNYRYRMLAYQEWRELYHDNKLNAAQRQFFETRPAEQLFDLQTDPHEVHNLAASPMHLATLQDLRERLAKKVKSLPDLSLIPENMLAEQAFQNPAKFGKQNQARIAQLVDVADLSLLPVATALPELRKSLSAQDPLIRYWALISCSALQVTDADILQQAKKLATSDAEVLVRVRAAEFLGLMGQADPAEVILAALQQSQSGIEAGLILNSLTLLQDGQPGYDFELQKNMLNQQVLKNDTVQRRLEYLLPE